MSNKYDIISQDNYKYIVQIYFNIVQSIWIFKKNPGKLAYWNYYLDETIDNLTHKMTSWYTATLHCYQNLYSGSEVAWFLKSIRINLWTHPSGSMGLGVQC